MSHHITKISLYFVLLLSAPAYAASFDCKQAKSSSEIFICKDSQLSELDSQVAKAFKQSRQLQHNKKQFDADAVSKWQQRERTCHANKQCLVTWYQQRLDELSSRKKITGMVYQGIAELVNETMLPYTAMKTNQKITTFSTECNGWIHSHDVQLIGKVDFYPYRGKKASFIVDCSCHLHNSHIRDLTCSIVTKK